MSVQPQSKAQPERKTRIMIVDDSAVIRAVISRTLGAEADMEIVGIAPNGDAAVKNLKIYDPDIVVLDIEMPVMDGLTALPLLLREKPGVRVLICSTLSARGADISIRALSLGATDCILKPGGDAIVSAADFQKNLVGVIRQLALGIRKRAIGPAAASPKANFALRKDQLVLPPQIVAIGSSTGGPKVLMDVLKDLRDLPVPIVITQHMPKTFTAMLAQHITQNCGIACFEGAEGQILKPGEAYVAPGGTQHMTLRKAGQNVVVHLDDGPPENYCRPSVNPMLRSLMPIYGNRILTVILTGMGADGSQVCAELAKEGAPVIAQDEATSTVWGMPGAVAMAGLCNAVIPPEEIGHWVRKSLKGETP